MNFKNINNTEAAPKNVAIKKTLSFASSIAPASGNLDYPQSR
jgi:hypothetical protein